MSITKGAIDRLGQAAAQRYDLGLMLLGMMLLPSLGWAAGGDLGVAEKQATNWVAIGMFTVFVGLTLGITKWAASQSKSRADFYTAGGGITGFQNGLAIAGDYMSAASFLGISAMVFSKGYDGLLYSIGFLVGWPIILFIVAERLRNLGRFTFADVAAYRLRRGPIRTLAAVSTLVVVAFYLIAQMVGAGQLIKLLFGLDYTIAVVVVGVLMMVYVLFGGMLATTWVQIIKAVMLLAGASFMAFMVLKHFGFSLEAMFAKAVEVYGQVNKTDGHKIMGPGSLVSNPVDAVSLGVALMFGTAGLPHILMRFFTVGNAREARKSVFYATGFIGYFYLLTFVIGFGAILFVASNPHYLDAVKMAETGKLELIGGSNMPAVHLAHALGGDWFLGFISAVAFATILAVVAGLTLSGASAVSHDLYANVIAHGRATEAQEMRVSRMAVVGLVSSLVLILLTKAVWVETLKLGETAPIPYTNPALFSMGLAFFACWLFSVTDRSAQADEDKAGFDAQFVRAITGIGASKASDH